MNMDDLQIYNALRKNPVTCRFFIRVYSCDELKMPDKYPACLIVNTDPHWEKGKHWLAMYMESEKTLEFFDSFGHGPEYYGGFISRFAAQFKYIYCKVSLQSQSSSVCGHYCICFLYSRCFGYTFRHFLCSIMNICKCCQICQCRDRMIYVVAHNLELLHSRFRTFKYRVCFKETIILFGDVDEKRENLGNLRSFQTFKRRFRRPHPYVIKN